MQTNHYRQIIPPCVLLEKTQQLLSELQKGTGLVDLTKYYKVESKLDLANLSKEVTMSAIFGRLIGSIQNRSMMPNVIKYWDYQTTVFDAVLKRHQPSEVLITYNNADELYHAILERWMDKKPLNENCQGLWRQWCEGVLSAASFLTRFNNVKDLHDSFKLLYDNPWTKPALPSLLAMEISGIQFALACDFLKECGYDYPKPDSHLADVLEQIIGTKQTYLVFKAVIQYAEALNMSAYKFDKMLWLVCSGNFYLDNVKVKDKKEELIEFIKTNSTDK